MFWGQSGMYERLRYICERMLEEGKLGEEGGNDKDRKRGIYSRREIQVAWCQTHPSHSPCCCDTELMFVRRQGMIPSLDTAQLQAYTFTPLWPLAYYHTIPIHICILQTKNHIL